MGKKVTRQQAASVKISKKDHSKHHHHEQQQQFNSLIKVLRPKVYITDPSSFKKLVQELTGNNGTISSSTSIPLPSLQPKLDYGDHHHHHHQVQLRVEPSVSSEEPTSSSSGLCNYDDSQLMMNVEEQDYFDQFCNSDLQELDDAFLGDYVNTSVAYDHRHQIDYVESLLFNEQVEEELTPFYAQVEQDISIYDYDF